jgi:SAM-dependent methyltransferase
LIERCCNCGIWITTPPPTNSLKQTVECEYEDDYYTSWAINEQGFENLKKIKSATFDIILKTLEKFLKPGTLLDVGCAMGFSLDEAKNRGWNPYGIDISRYACKIARQNFGDNVYIGEFLKTDLPRDFFYAVTMHDFMEHLDKPDCAISKAKNILKKGGILVIVTPSTSSLTAKIFGRFWPHIKFEHKIYMNPYNISVFLRRYNFRVLEVKNTLKVFNLCYVINQFKKYPLPFITTTMNILERLIPQQIKLKTFCVSCGEISVFAKKL